MFCHFNHNHKRRWRGGLLYNFFYIFFYYISFTFRHFHNDCQHHHHQLPRFLISKMTIWEKKFPRHSHHHHHHHHHRPRCLTSKMTTWERNSSETFSPTQSLLGRSSMWVPDFFFTVSNFSDFSDWFADICFAILSFLKTCLFQTFVEDLLERAKTL